MTTIAERAHMGRVAELGCAVCRMLGYGPTPAEVHHQHLIARAIRDRPGMTYTEIAEVTGLERHAVGRRLKELHPVHARPGEVRNGMRTWWPVS